MKKIIIAILLFPVMAYSAGERIAWDAISDPSVNNVRVYQSNSNIGPWTLIKTVGVPLATVDCTVTSPGTYYWELTAVNSYGESVPSNIISEVFVASDFPAAAPTGIRGTKIK